MVVVNNLYSKVYKFAIHWFKYHINFLFAILVLFRVFNQNLHHFLFVRETWIETLTEFHAPFGKSFGFLKQDGKWSWSVFDVDAAKVDCIMLFEFNEGMKFADALILD